MKRSHYNTEINDAHIGTEVCVTGWVQKIRDIGSLIFIDLRDRTGIIQLSFDDSTDRDVFESARPVRSEFVVAAKGIVRSRGENVNKERKTGAVEIAVTHFDVLSKAETPPFEITDDANVNEELRLKYRYLDLRRPKMNGNIIFRHNVQRVTRNFFYDNGFIDIETPSLIKPTPEGARDYLVPSRVHNGKFYVLPQSPQLYKQLLMIAGFDRYFQIARCFRDEDLRADRQPEFTQVDLEMSFVDEEDIYAMMESYISTLFSELLGLTIQTPLPRLTYAECMDRFGADKPDLRFGYELQDLTSVTRNCGFKVFASAECVKAIVINSEAENISRKEIDSLTEFIKTHKAKGLAWYKYTDSPTSSYSKFLSDDENAAIISTLNAKPGDVIFIVADTAETVAHALGALRCEVARRLGKIAKDDFKILWVTDFPMFEYGEEEKRWFAKHHPFTQPRPEHLHFLESDPSKVLARAYDLVINGFEAGGGSIRINDPVMQQRILSFLGYDEQTARERFGFLLEAYNYAAPQHGGIAFGLDRLCTILLGLTSIRDVIAFPKVQNASDLMSGAPSFADESALAELGIAVVHNED